MKLADKTISSLLWMFAGTSTQTLMTVLVTSVLARLLSPHQFGLLSASLIVINFTMIFSQSGIGPALVQKNQLTSLHLRSAFTFSVLGGVLTSLAVWCLAPLLEKVLNADGIVPVLHVLSLTFIYQGFSVVSDALLQIELKFREIAMIRLCSYILGYGLVGVTMAFYHFGVWALVSGHMVQTSAQSLASIMLQGHQKRFSFDIRTLKELLWFGGGHTLARLGNYFALFGDKFVTARWLGVAALGLYERSYQFMVMPAVLIGNVLQQVLFPALSQIDDREKLLFAFKRGTAIISMVAMPVSVLCLLLAPEIVQVVLGSRWAAATLPFQILAIGMYFRTSYKIADSFTRSVGAVYKRAWVQWVYALLVFVGCIAGQRWGITGVSAAVLFALFMNYILMMNLSLRLLSYSWPKYILIHRSGFVTGCLSGIVAGIVLWLSRAVLHLHSVGTLASALISVAVVGSLMAWKFPMVFLGEEGLWLMAKLKERIMQKSVDRTDVKTVIAVASEAGE